MDQRDAICADHLLKRRANSGKKSRLFLVDVNGAGARLVVEFSDQMREHLGVGFRPKIGIARADKILFNRLIILDHTIVHEREPAAGVEMRVCVFVGHFAVRGPTGVTDPERTGKRLFPDQVGQCGDASGTFAGLQMPSIHDRYSRGIVASIFKTP